MLLEQSEPVGTECIISKLMTENYQRIEYTPYGETWVDISKNKGILYLPYKFSAKELDEETGLYYYGTRYLDPKTSIWISSDPALGEYTPAAGKWNSKDAGSLSGMGGVYNHINFHLYHYAGNNPVRYTDPNGMEVTDLDDAQKTIVLDKLNEAKNSLSDLSTKLQNYINDDNPNKVLDATIKDAAQTDLGIEIKDNKSAQKVLNGVNKTLKYLNSLKITDFKYDTEGISEDGTTGTLAYVYGGFFGLFDKKIYLTNCFFDDSWLPDSGSINKTGTIVHEGTHKGIGTDDIAYPHETEKFNSLTPKQQQKNAASWERFFNRIYKNGQ